MFTPQFKYKEELGKTFIYDIIRKKYILLTPEEWVRQQLLHHLIFQLKFPASMFQIEKQIKVGNKNKRFDILVHKKAIPWLLIECKQENETITKNNLAQIESYASILKVSFFILTNGRDLHCFDVDKKEWTRTMPVYEL